VVRADMLDERGRPLNQSLIPRPNRRAPDADHLSIPTTTTNRTIFTGAIAGTTRPPHESRTDRSRSRPDR